jgi:hypothetical protein
MARGLSTCHGLYTEEERAELRDFAKTEVPDAAPTAVCPKCHIELSDGQCINIDCAEFHTKHRPDAAPTSVGLLSQGLIDKIKQMSEPKPLPSVEALEAAMTNALYHAHYSLRDIEAAAEVCARVAREMMGGE